MSRHANISVFVPHIGCSHRCSFCDQNAITGIEGAPTGEDVTAAVETAPKTPNYDPENTEIAFFGGSFTAIERSYMLSLLKPAYEYVKSGAVGGIRLSTRPDAIDREILELLRSNGVTSIELGAQSMRDTVLIKNGRGHTAADVKNASRLIKEYGFSLGLQMMTGLYGDDDEGARFTASEISGLSPDTVRIYPAITLKNTRLAALYKKGEYLPQTLEEAVKLCAGLLDFFNKKDINVIRLGLHTVNANDYVAGPWHPAFRELCEARLYLDIALSMLGKAGDYELYVNEKEISKMTGQSRRNIEILAKMGYNCTVKGEKDLAKYEIKIKECEHVAAEIH